MRFRALAAVAILLAIVAVSWRADLLTLARPGAAPRPLRLVPQPARKAEAFEVVLPAVPVGMRRLSAGSRVLLVHYWAPWERHSRSQAALLDSLRREPGLERLDVVVVCFDPFPSVARFVARQRLRLPVLLDGEGRLRRSLPCPSVPYTYVIDARGRVAVAQPGEIDWWSPRTIEALRSLLGEPADPPALTVGPSRL